MTPLCDRCRAAIDRSRIMVHARVSGRLIRLMLSPLDVLAVEYKDKYLHIHTMDGATYLEDMSLTRFLSAYGDLFFKSHRSWAFQRGKVIGVLSDGDDWTAHSLMIDGFPTLVPVSRLEWPRVRAYLDGLQPARKHRVDECMGAEQ